MVKKKISLFLSVIIAFSLCNTSFALDWKEEYNVFMLPVISDKLPNNQQTARIEVYLDKTEDIAFVSLDDICKIIGAKCSQEESRYAVKRDAVYFSYNGKDNMELYLLEQNSTSAFVDGAEMAVGSIIHDKIIGHRLLNGNLFESRKINDKWYVDYIRFCDMFGIKLSKYTSNNHNNLNGLVQTLDIVLENDVQFDFDSNPYYVRMYSGTTLSSIYQKVMRNRKTYLFDFYTFEIKNNNFWDNVLQKSGAMYQLASLQYKNILSNLINDWNGFTSALIDQYEPGEHYTESLLNILNTNYLKYVIQNHGSDKSIPTFSDFVECVANFYSDLLDNLLDNEPTWIADALTYNENLENYIEFINALAENNNDYSKALASMADDDLALGLPAVKIVLNSVSAFTEVHNTFKQINNLSSDKMNLLQKGIFENETLEAESSKVNISGAMDKIFRIKNILYPMGAFDMAGNYAIKASQNFENNAKGLIDSARKIYDTYGKIGEQNFEKLKEVLKTSVYTAIDEGAQLILHKFPATVPIAVAMSAIDGAMALGKFAIGEELKDAESFVQYYYIEQNLLCNLSEWNPEKLHSNLTFALMASLCCYESQKKVMENDLKKITENKEIDLPEEYFQRIEEQRKEFDNSINQIAEVLYQLDHQKTQLCIDYYHDPRNNNVSEDAEEAILHYNDGIISGKVPTDSSNGLYAAYLKVINDLVNDYGEGSIIIDESNKWNDRYCLNGLGVVKLLDFDGDGQEELLCVCGKYDKNQLYNYKATVKLFGFMDNKAVLLYQDDALFYGADPKYHLHYLPKNQKIFLQTKSAHQTIIDTEWSELRNSKMEVIKTFEKKIEPGTAVLIYKIDGKTITDHENFHDEIENFEKGKIDYTLNDNRNYSELENILSETNLTLEKIGYAVSNLNKSDTEEYTALDLMDKSVSEIIELMGGEFQVDRVLRPDFYFYNDEVFPNVRFWIDSSEYHNSEYKNGEVYVNGKSVEQGLRDGDFSKFRIAPGSLKITDRISSVNDYEDLSETLGNVSIYYKPEMNRPPHTGGALAPMGVSLIYEYFIDDKVIVFYFDNSGLVKDRYDENSQKVFTYEEAIKVNPRCHAIEIKK